MTSLRSEISIWRLATGTEARVELHVNLKGGTLMNTFHYGGSESRKIHYFEILKSA